MTLYLLFERLESGKLKLDTEMEVSEHASEQAPTKLGLRPGQTLSVEDAIKGLVTRSANDAAVVIAEAIAGDEDDFAKLMTRKARALGMSRTVYRNAIGLPDDEQVTTARDQATLGRAIQERFPRYYRYFATSTLQSIAATPIRNHNRLLGRVEGVDGIKTGYTRASGFNLVTSMRRGNRHLVGVVLGGRSGGSRDAIMRNLLAENLEKGADQPHRRRDHRAQSLRKPMPRSPKPRPPRGRRRRCRPGRHSGRRRRSRNRSRRRPRSIGQSRRCSPLPPRPCRRTPGPAARPQARTEPAPLTSGVIQTQPIAAIPGSSEPMKPVRVKTVQVKAGQIKLASAGPTQPAPPITHAIPPPREVPRPPAPWWRRPRLRPSPKLAIKPLRTEMPPQPANHGTGHGILGVLPASSASPAARLAGDGLCRAGARVPAAGRAAERRHQAASARPHRLDHSGRRARKRKRSPARLEAARDQASGLLGKADPFTETVAKGDKKLYRARFAGLDRDQAEAVCKTLKRSDISCITVRN